jgi:4a-hydroxytetrahydrobiopterin dehydratase
MSTDLSVEKCIPCSIGTPPMEGEELKEMLESIDSSWILVEDRKIEKNFKFKDFKTALDFVNKVGDIAEAEGHHPDIELGWGKVKITLLTHKIGGLSRNDFVLAAKINKIEM